jgi:hypothetical protein
MTVNRTITARAGATAVDAFIASAPNGEPLVRISDIARRMRQSDAALMNRAIHEQTDLVAT